MSISVCREHVVDKAELSANKATELLECLGVTFSLTILKDRMRTQPHSEGDW